MSIGLVTSTRLLFLDEKAFSASCLPVMLALAKRTKRIIAWSLRDYPKKWSYLDKLLVFLDPEFKADIEKFYDNEGPSMKDLYDDTQLDNLDELITDQLKKKLNILVRENR
jgi:hypothetical protein